MLNGLKRTRESGQSLWLNGVGRESLSNGLLRPYIRDWAVTGVAVHLETVRQTLRTSHLYDSDLARLLPQGIYGEPLAHELVLEDVRFAADQLRNVYEKTRGVDGWVVLPVWPLSTEEASVLPGVVKGMHAWARRPNVLISLPSCRDMYGAIQDIVHAGVPVKIDGVCTPDHFQEVCEALRLGMEKRLSDGLSPSVVFISVDVHRLKTLCQNNPEVSDGLSTSISLAREIYAAFRQIHGSRQWERLYQIGCNPMRIVWQDDDGGTEVIHHLVCPFTVALLSEEAMWKYLGKERNLVRLETDGPLAADQLSNLYRESDSLLKSEMNLQVKNWINLLETVAQKSAELSRTENG